jgi:hypothetical protein
VPLELLRAPGHDTDVARPPPPHAPHLMELPKGPGASRCWDSNGTSRALANLLPSLGLCLLSMYSGQYSHNLTA